MDTPTLFPTPNAYTDTIKLADIWPAATHGAKSKATRSLKAFGMLTLPLVREAQPQDAPGRMRYRVVDGARRIADLREMGTEEVAVVILPHAVSESTAAAIGVAMNYGRAPNPIQEAIYFDALLNSGYEPEGLSTMLGISKSKIKRRMALVYDLDEGLGVMLHAGHMNVGVAEKAARLPAEKQAELAQKMRDGEIERLSNEDISDALRDIRQGMLAQGELLEDASPMTPAGMLRFHLRNLRGQGLDRHTALTIVEELYANS